MSTQPAKTLYEALTAPFGERDLEFKIQTCGKGNNGIWALVVPYITNRAIQDRLDQVVGPESWRNRFEIVGKDQGGILCGISIKIEGEWIEKVDGAEPTDIEPFKGGLSNAMKRAAVQWGIGRFLYGIGDCWAHVHEKGAHHGKTKDNDRFNWDPPKMNFAQAEQKPAPAPARKEADIPARPATLMQPAPAAPNPSATQDTAGKAECDDLYHQLVGDKGILHQNYKPLVSALFKASPTFKDRFANLTALLKAVQQAHTAMGKNMAINMLEEITLGLSIDRKAPSDSDASEWLIALCHMADTGEVLHGVERQVSK